MMTTTTTPTADNNAFWRIMSRIFSPMLMPTYGMAMIFWGTPLRAAAERPRIFITLAVFLTTCIVPALVILALMRAKLVSSPSIPERRQRYIPVALMVVCFAFCAWYTWRAMAPTWVVMFLLGGGTASLIACLINLRYKVSLHALGAGAICALTFVISYAHLVGWPMIWISASWLIAGLVCTARLQLHRHTPGQLALGFAIGLAVETACALPFMLPY